MLLGLNLRNFTVIDEIAVSFGPGLNIITGETGAGKSVIIDAVNVMLGDRVSPEYVKTGREEAHLEALFDISDKPAVKERLESLGFDVSGGELLIKRIIYRKGRSRAFLNGGIATLPILERASEGIIDIFSQHEHQSLLKSENHIRVLDEFGGHGVLADEQRGIHARFRDINREIERLKAEQKSLFEREDFLKFQRSEIDDALLREGEDSELEEEKKRLLNSERLLSAARGAYEALYESEPSLLGSLSRLSSDVREAAGIDPLLREAGESIENSALQLKDAAFALRDYASGLSFESGRLEVIEERLQEIKDLKRKFGDSIEAILRKREEIGRELRNIAGYEGEFERLGEESLRIESEMRAGADKLSALRKESAKKLSRSLEKELKEVGIKGARFEVVIAEKEISSDGKDDVSFLFSANPDEAPKPLARVASGGELSRIMLVLKELISKEEGGSVIIFDEADSGIGGAVAETVGKKIKNLSRSCQVICITHLPQVAKFADTHLLVTKTLEDKKTQVRIKSLGKEERVQELARMIGGIDITEKTIEAAREMLGA
ncbi:MAG: DNA repair protein RecN [Thermodesulfobacteriota bacterium]